ncbi:hypothetical protein PILCRDRAFT_680559 [Piloderma croceum F 1598]|uniref:Major facilitator superfamily (MFS) profile domain-containing protein n=1 Tax=Piloderma croceum (strain F 1598) TaxID=765440 RepID=A0A0C3ERV6_PILCF|nr:hypothetical protein PILCRDRAFT_680559 [Piloderma croceum F 1598]
MDTPKNENSESETISASQAAILDSGAKPEGGVTAWCTVAGGWMALFATFGYISSFGVYQDLYVLAGTASSFNVSWIGSTQLWFFIAMGLPAGGLLDKGYFKHLILVGSIIYVFSLFMLSLAHVDSYYQIFLSQGVGMGIGAGLIYLPAMAVQAHHWKTRRALAMGIVITGSSFGGIVYPILLNNLFNSSVGFAWGVRASAFLTLAMLAGANCLMSGKPKGDATGLPKAKLRDILTDTPFMLGPVIGGFLLALGVFFPYFYLQLFTNLHGLPSTFAFYTLTIQNGASILGRTIPNFLADRYGVINTITVMSFATGALVFAMLGIDSVGGVVAFAILYGFCSGGVLSLGAPLMARFIRDESEIGMRLGVAYFLNSFAYLAGPPVSGALLGSQNRWVRPIIFSAVVLLAGVVPVLLIARMLQAKRKGTQYV